MESEEIVKWCKDKGIDVKRAIVLSEVSFETPDDAICKALDDAKIFGHCKVRGRCSAHTGKSQTVLVETTTDMTAAQLPEQIVAGDEWGSWVVNVSETQSFNPTAGKGGFQSKLLSFLASEGKTLEDVTGLLSPSPAPRVTPELNTDLSKLRAFTPKLYLIAGPKLPSCIAPFMTSISNTCL
ncbi:Paraneoplastic antigen [Xyrichtys novacula]|uniref:Paraneoplastic antigen n=1 Tax=Xyrichtys novacula TaxID=13765 RepID=A0AAV1GMI7_XYRNO|nr:Paraneoplastic antigen [Xyrichtys novacula]